MFNFNKKTMIRFYATEKWKEIKVPKSLKFRYAVSNYGRLLSFTNKFKDGQLLKGSKVDGYPVFSYKVRVKDKTKDEKFFIHKLVAEQFLKRKTKKHIYVIHLDRLRTNNSIRNLKLVTKEERLEHNKKSPLVIAARKKLILFNKKRDGAKLSTTKVISLKKKLKDPKRKTSLKIIAKQFGISEMQLYRIKSGENWGHIKI